MKTNKTSPPAKKLLDQVRDKIRFKHYNLSTEDSYISWIKQYIIFNGKRYPTEIGAVEVAHQQGVFFFRRVPCFVKQGHTTENKVGKFASAWEPVGFK